MTIENFNGIVQGQLDACINMLIEKGVEYAPEATHEIPADRLTHFKKAAAIMGVTPEAALFGMLSKHIVSISDMCLSGQSYPIEKWGEKITDSVNYLLILRAIAEEQLNGQN